jgi:hypothetical protein
MADEKKSIEVLDELALKIGVTNSYNNNFSVEEKENLDKIFSNKDSFLIKNSNGSCLSYISDDLIKKVKNGDVKINNKLSITNADKDIIRADGAFNPLIAYYAGKIKSTFKQKLNCFGASYTKANNEVGYSTKDAEVSDFIDETEYEGNPFAKYSAFNEELENAIYPGEVDDYYDSNVTSNEAIKIESLNYGIRQSNMARNQRQAFIIKRDMLNEMGFERVEAEEYINNAINNKIEEMKIREMQKLVYNSLLSSNKFTSGGSKYNEVKDKLFVNNTPWSKQSPAQFFDSMSYLRTLFSQMDSERMGEKNIIVLSRQEIADLKQPFYPTQFVNATGVVSNPWPFSSVTTRLGALFAAGADIVVEALGLDEFNTYFKFDTNNKKMAFIYKKELFKFGRLLKPGIINMGAISDIYSLKDKSKYTYTSPINMSTMVAEIHTPLLTATFKYDSSIIPFSFKFSL